MLPPVKERWTPLYYQRGRLEQNNYSIQFVHSDGVTEAIPVAQISCIMLGPGTTITHAAVVSCAKHNTPIVWVGEDALYFYAYGVEVNEKCQTARIQAELFSNESSREEIARKMFKTRYGEDVANCSIASLRGKEGVRVRDLYISLAKKHGVYWSVRNSSGMVIKETPQGVNFLLNVANKWLYSLCLSAITTMGYIPSLGFVHCDGKIPFVYDIADLYKEEYSIATCFEVFGRYGENLDMLAEALKQKVIKGKLLRQIPKDLKELIK